MTQSPRKEAETGELYSRDERRGEGLMEPYGESKEAQDA